jgi:RNA polymerase sigma-70 factor (ECF subfamily)
MTARETKREMVATTTATHNGDTALVAAMAAGDRNALARLYDRYSGVLLAVGVRILSDRREAEDLLHDVFIEAWRQAERYDHARGTVRTWLIMRMRSRALDRRRSAGFARSVSMEGVEPPNARPDDPSAPPDHSVVRKALAALPADQRAVLELGYFEGLSSSEIATRQEIPIGTVKSRVAAALAKLREGLAKSGGVR